jgi:hypothetical protein
MVTSPIFDADSISELAAAQFFVNDIVFQRQSHGIDFMFVLTYVTNTAINSTLMAQ